MAHESFEDEEIAEVLNTRYVAIKVDREERPDVDAVYMSAVQAMSGRGGWPMTVWLTPSGKPFFAGTYFPARDGDRGTSYGFLTLLKALADRYQSSPMECETAAEHVASVIQEHLLPSSGAMPSEDVIERAMDTYREHYDAQYGGLKPAPKFPTSLPIRLCLRRYATQGDSTALDMATATLMHMAKGGIHDHLAGGFHRYSTDARWLVPHFEKMLYDNALLVLCYLDGYQATHNDLFREVVDDTLAYVTREMTTPEGGFYSATDADSVGPTNEHGEGWYFTWTPQEIAEVLGETDGDIVSRYFGVTPEGNFEGRNVLHVNQSLESFAEALGKPPLQVAQLITLGKQKLQEARSQRPLPALDDKVLLSWNALMIQAFARASRVLDHAPSKYAALSAADFIITKMSRDSRLFRSYSRGETRHPGYLQDYACWIAALLDLFELTGDVAWLNRAMAYDRVLEELFEDKERGGYFLTSHAQERLIAREKPAYDGAEPSGNSTQALNLARLYSLSTDASYLKRLTRTLEAFGPRMEAAPTTLSEMLLALDVYRRGSKEVVIVTPGATQEAGSFMAEWREKFAPGTMLLVLSQSQVPELVSRIPWLAGKHAIHGKPTAYVCANGTCALPTQDAKQFAAQLDLRVSQS